MVGGDDALIVQAEAAGQIGGAGQAAKVGGGVGGGTGEALIEIGAEASEHGVGLFQSNGLSEAKFADQAVLTGAPGTLDAALSLRRVGGDLLDAEFIEGASELSGSLFSGKLFGKSPVRIVALEDTVAIAVEAERDAVRGDHGVQSAEVAHGVFGFELEVSGKNLAGGVVLKTDEGEQGTAAFEPVVAAGIGEGHHAQTGAGGTAGAVLLGPRRLRRGGIV